MRRVLLTLIFCCVIPVSFAQSTSINYKAQLKDEIGGALANQAVTFRMTILQGASQNNIYQETHSTNTTEDGLVILLIGEGNIELGDYESIDWLSDLHFLNVQVDAGSGFVDLGTSPFNAVPYALNSLNGVRSLEDLSDVRTNEGSSLLMGDTVGLNSTGTGNTAIGQGAFIENTTGIRNTALGNASLRYNTTGDNNTSLGNQSLYFNNGSENTAIGVFSMAFNEVGNENTAVGFAALNTNTTGSKNTAVGVSALTSNIEGNENTAIGYAALGSNNLGFNNTAVGVSSLEVNTTGAYNTAIGYTALQSNISGSQNTAMGFNALVNNTTGANNLGLGTNSLESNTTGNGNIALGINALSASSIGNINIAIGNNALSNLNTGFNNIAIGDGAQVSSNNGANQIRMGNTAVTSANIQVAWNVTSDRRWKEQIRTLPYGLDFVKQLRPVDYVRKNNDAKTRETGFIAQDVKALMQKVGYTDQGLLSEDDKGFLSLRYNDLIAILVRALQEQQEIIEQLQEKELKNLAAQNNIIKSLVQRLDLLEDRSETSKSEAITFQK